MKSTPNSSLRLKTNTNYVEELVKNMKSKTKMELMEYICHKVMEYWNNYMEGAGAKLLLWTWLGLATSNFQITFSFLCMYDSMQRFWLEFLCLLLSLLCSYCIVGCRLLLLVTLHRPLDRFTEDQLCDNPKSTSNSSLRKKKMTPSMH